MKSFLMAAMVMAAAACGGGSDEPDYDYVPIVSSTLDGHLRGEPLTFDAGIATRYTPSGAPIFIFGVGDINCAAFEGNERPQGTYAYVVVPGPIGTELAVQTYEDAGVNIESYQGTRTNIIGTDGATLTISAITETTVSGSISFSYVYEGEELGALAGDFEVTRCP